MRYKKEVFKKYYGKIYFDIFKYTILIDATALIIIFAMLVFNTLTQEYVTSATGIFLGGLSFFVIFVSVFPFLPVLFCYYVKALKMSERQKQWIEDGKIQVLLTPVDGNLWGVVGRVKHTKKYVVNKLEMVYADERFIRIYGDITYIDNYRGARTTRQITECKIPRNFSNEEQILKLGGQ